MSRLALALIVGVVIGTCVGLARVEIRTASMRVQCEHDGGHWSRGLGWDRLPYIVYTCRYG